MDVGAASRSGSLSWARVGDDGTLTRSGTTPIVADYVASLGSPDPVIVGTTPYGREALVGEALGEIITESGDTPSGLGIVHDDGLDEYRLTMLVESARLAGIPPDRVVLVPRSQAAAAGGGDDESRGAAATALTMLSTGGGGTSAAVAAAGAGGGIGGAILGSQLLQGGGTALAAGAAAGPAGAALAGPAGTALAGPGGAALAGPAGAAAAGPVGGAVAGAAGTPLGTSGPAGTVLVPAAQAASKAKWIPILGGAAVGVAAIVGVAVVVAGGDDEAVVTTEPPAVVTIPDTVPDTPTPSITTPETTIATATIAEATTTAASTTTSSSTSSTTSTMPPVTDFSVLLGSWQTGCIEEAGGVLQAVYTISGSSPDALNLHSDNTVFAGEGCSGAIMGTAADDTPMRVAGMTVVDGLDTFQVATPDGNGIMTVDGNTLYIGAFEDTSSFPTAFDPMWTSTRA